MPSTSKFTTEQMLPPSTAARDPSSKRKDSFERIIQFNPLQSSKHTIISEWMRIIRSTFLIGEKTIHNPLDL
jgi:peroxiredoxin